jgi:predicted nucleic acid-binding Zn ribbon protein
VPDTDEPGEELDPTGGEPTGIAHDDAGLDLARLIARSLAGAGAPARRRKPGTRRRRTDAQVSGAHPDDRDPQLLDTTLGRLVSDHGWEVDLRVHGVFGRWAELVGAEIAAHCSPETFADGKLTVRTDSTAWATQLTLLAATVVRRLNEELGDGTVRVLDVKGPHGPSWTKGRLTVKGRGPRDTYG